ncbi:MAG: aspartate aminotransferase [Halobacteriales archaeon]|jgi:aspartate aminotransferase
MAIPVTDRVASVDRSKIRVMYDMAEESIDEDLVRLEVGEPDFDTPEHITEAAFEAARGGATHYTSNAGLPELRQAIADRLQMDRGVDVDPDAITVTTGGMEALHLAMLAVVSPDEEVLVPTPAWPNYVQQARLADARPVKVPMPEADGFDLDPERVIQALSEDTALVVLNSPSNPTGRVFDTDAVREVVDAAAAHDAYVVADESYAALTYEGEYRGIAGLVDRPERVLTVGTCSKEYAMTGWRLGWLAGPETVIDHVTKIHESTTACASSVAQHAAIAALTGPREPIEAMREAFHDRRDLVVDRIDGMPGLSCPRPEGAFYAFVDVSTLDGTSMAVAERLLKQYGVVVAPGEGFGDAGRGRVRISFANSMERLETGLDRIERMARDELGE